MNSKYPELNLKKAGLEHLKWFIDQTVCEDDHEHCQKQIDIAES